MFSLQTIFGKGDKFYGLLEASADAARQSTRALIAMLNQKIARARRSTNSASRAGAKSSSWRRSARHWSTRSSPRSIAKTSRRCRRRSTGFQKSSRNSPNATRCSPSQLMDIDYASRAVLLEKADGVIVDMVGAAAQGHEARRNEGAQRPHAGDRERGRPPDSRSVPGPVQQRERASRLILRKDLFELLEKAIDRCRDAGNVIYAIVLKNS